MQDYPKLMMKGTANIPQRFWDYMWVEDEESEDLLRKNGDYCGSSLECTEEEREARTLPPFANQEDTSGQHQESTC